MDFKSRRFGIWSDGSGWYNLSGKYWVGILGIEISVIGWDWMWVVTWGMAGDCGGILLVDNAEGAYLLLSEEWKCESYW